MLWWRLIQFSTSFPSISTDLHLLLAIQNNSKISSQHVYIERSSGEIFLAATKQLYEWYFLSACPSVPPFWLCSHHRIIMKFSGVITKDQGKEQTKSQGQRPKVKVTEVTTHLNRFRTVTRVWIHIWWRNDTYSLILIRRGALLFFMVIR